MSEKMAGDEKKIVTPTVTTPTVVTNNRNNEWWEEQKRKKEAEEAARMKLIDEITPHFEEAWNSFDGDALKRICQMETAEFEQYAARHTNGEQQFFYKDNGSPILGVCHLDSVQKNRTFDIARTAFGNIVFCPVLDDRLGAYIILEWLPKLGIQLDYLLCDDEESGKSTAKIFRFKDPELAKRYNWLAEFDRKGEDVVMYHYETPELKTLLEEYGWKVGWGSFTDISALSHLGCKGFNFGVSYDDYHSIKAQANLDNLCWTLGKFIRFYHALKDTHLAHDPDVTKKEYGTSTTSTKPKTVYNGHEYSDYGSEYWNGVANTHDKDDADGAHPDDVKKNAAKLFDEKGNEIDGYGKPIATESSSLRCLFDPIPSDDEEEDGEIPERFRRIVTMAQGAHLVRSVWEDYQEMLQGDWTGPCTGLAEDELLALGEQRGWRREKSYLPEDGHWNEFGDWEELKCLLDIVRMFENCVTYEDLEQYGTMWDD